MALQKSCVETCSFSSFQSILQKTKGEIQPFLYVSMRGQHRPAEPSLKAFNGQDNFIQLLASSLWFMSGSAAATRREEVHVKGLDGPKYSSILRPLETEIQFVISWVQVWRGQTSCAQQDLHLTDFSGKFPVSYWKIKRVSEEVLWTVPTILSTQSVAVRCQPLPCQSRSCQPRNPINSPKACMLFTSNPALLSTEPANTPLKLLRVPTAETLAMQLYLDCPPSSFWVLQPSAKMGCGDVEINQT